MSCDQRKFRKNTSFSIVCKNPCCVFNLDTVKAVLILIAAYSKLLYSAISKMKISEMKLDGSTKSMKKERKKE